MKSSDKAFCHDSFLIAFITSFYQFKKKSKKISKINNNASSINWMIIFFVSIRSFELWDSVNIRFLKSRVGDLNKFGLFSQFLKVVSTTVAHTTLDSTSISLEDEFQWTSERNITFNTLSAESLWIDITSSSFHFGNICTH